MLKEVGQMEEERIRQASAESESIEAPWTKNTRRQLHYGAGIRKGNLINVKLIPQCPPGADFVLGLMMTTDEDDDDFER
jgi:hypothetical protein